MNLKQFEDVNCSRGALMGRAENRGPVELAYKVELFKVRFVDCGYDDGGAYWGTGQPLFCARGESADGEHNLELFYRADNMTDAAELLAADYPRVVIVCDTEKEITRGAALAFFAMAYAEQAEECDKPLSGEIMDQLPEDIDTAAIHAARIMVADMVRANGAPIAELYADNPGNLSPEEWGSYAALGALGTGCGLWEYVGDSVDVPHAEFGSHSLENDYFGEPT